MFYCWSLGSYIKFLKQQQEENFLKKYQRGKNDANQEKNEI